MTITGESFDYGPWRFVPAFDASFVAAYFDSSGLYAYGRQPAAVEWNLSQLANALRLIAPTAPLGSVLVGFEERYDRALANATVRRLGLSPGGDDIDAALAVATWSFLESSRMSFEGFFFDLFGGSSRIPRALAGPRGAGYSGARWETLRALVEAHEPRPVAAVFDREGVCSMLIDEVETIWEAIARHDDWSLLERKIVDIRDVGASFALTA